MDKTISGFLLLVSFFFLFSLIPFVSAEEETQLQIEQLDQAVNGLFDSSGNLKDIQKYDGGFLEISQKFRAMPYPLKAIFNNHNIQVNFLLNPNRIKAFGIRVKNENIESFTGGIVSNPTLRVSLDIETFDQIRQVSGENNTHTDGLSKAIKSGKLKIESTDFFTNVAIGIYKLFI